MLNASFDNDSQLSTLRAPAAELAVLERACDELINCNSVPVAKELRDSADLLMRHVRTARLGVEVVNKVAEVKIRAERRAGQLLRSLNLQGGDRLSQHSGDRITLDTLGITRVQSCRWQKISSIPEEVFEQIIRAANEDRFELTTTIVLRLANPRKRRTVVGAAQTMSGAQSPPRRKMSSPPHEIISELQNHCTTLDGILSPALDAQGPVEFRTIEKRHIKQLLRNCQTLLSELKESVCPEANGSAPNGKQV